MIAFRFYIFLFSYIQVFQLSTREKRLGWLSDYLLLDSDALNFYARILWKCLYSNS